MAAPKNSALPDGSWVYRNWRADRNASPETYAEEIPLYSDARFVGELADELSPYSILNPVPEPHEPGVLVPALVLRLSVHLGDDTEAMIAAFRNGTPDTNSFVGGSVYDELASLLSLAHGARLAPGPATRWFHQGDTDRRGTPRYSQRGTPVLPTGKYETVIPSLRRTVQLRADLIESYPRLNWPTARELARAAGSYRRAVWHANSDGNLSWLHLVSAAETAANEWARLSNADKLTPVEVLRAVKPDYAQNLEKAAGTQAEEVLSVVGLAQADVLRAHWKFREFLIAHLPDPPEPRPQAFGIEWTADAIRKPLSAVYAYRSSALHGSSPFPPPMCSPPFPSEDANGNRALGERPGGAVFDGGGLWTEAQLPLNLHAFHHLVRGAILKWWAQLPVTAKEGALQTGTS